MDDGKACIGKCFNGFVIPVISQYNPFFNRQQVAGIGPLLSGTERKFVITRKNDLYVALTMQILFADIDQQVFQTFK